MTNINHRRRSLVGNRSKAGGVKRRNHFTATDATFTPLPKSDGKNHGHMRYAVKVRGHIVSLVGSNTQAASMANTVGGYVSIL